MQVFIWYYYYYWSAALHFRKIVIQGMIHAEYYIFVFSFYIRPDHCAIHIIEISYASKNGEDNVLYGM